jgi:hypothetical protein
MPLLNDRLVTAETRIGTSVPEPSRQEAFGVEAWLLDLEGNRLLLFVS